MAKLPMRCAAEFYYVLEILDVQTTIGIIVRLQRHHVRTVAAGDEFSHSDCLSVHLFSCIFSFALACLLTIPYRYPVGEIRLMARILKSCISLMMKILKLSI